MTGAADWGIARWARPILDTVLDGVSNTVDYQLAQLLPPAPCGTERYFRIQPEIKAANQSMDNIEPGNLAELKSSVAKTIAVKSKEIDSICAQLT